MNKIFIPFIVFVLLISSVIAIDTTMSGNYNGANRYSIYGLTSLNATKVYGSLSWSYLNNIPSYVKDYSSDISNLQNTKATITHCNSGFVLMNSTDCINVSGNAGPQGPQGIQGIQGIKGLDGINGTNGINGTSINITSVSWNGGISNTTWSNNQSFISPNLTGIKGDKGDQGIQGVSGTNGVDSVNANQVLNTSSNVSFSSVNTSNINFNGMFCLNDSSDCVLTADQNDNIVIDSNLTPNSDGNSFIGNLTNELLSIFSHNIFVNYLEVHNSINATGNLTVSQNIYLNGRLYFSNSNPSTISDLNFPNIGAVYDGDDSQGKGTIWSINNTPVWDFSTYQNENMKFMYWGYSYRTGNTLMTVSESGRVGINKLDNFPENQVFTNTTNFKYSQSIFNVVSTSQYSGETPNEYLFKMLNTTLIGYYRYNNGGIISSQIANWTIIPFENHSVELNLTIMLNETIIPQNTSWYFIAQPQVPQSTMSIAPVIFQYVLFNNISSGFIDQTAGASTSNSGTVYQSSFTGLDRNNSGLYIGRGTPFRSIYITVQTSGVGVNRSIYYCNSTGGFSQLLNFTDNTINLTVSGSISYDINTFGWSNNCNVNGVTGQYWMYINSTSQVTTSPVLSGFSPQGISRFRIYSMGGDVIPIVDLDVVKGIANFSTLGLFGGGGNITSLSGTAITQGTVADARLPATMTAKTITGSWVGTNAQLTLQNLTVNTNMTIVGNITVGANSWIKLGNLNISSGSCSSTTEGYMGWNFTSHKGIICNGTAWNTFSLS